MLETMDDAGSLALFAHVADRPEEDLDLFEAALLLADREYPKLDAAHYTREIEALGQTAKRVVAAGPDAIARVRLFLRFLYEDVGFHANEAEYYDPRNSFLNEVLDRRTGIPISLGVVVLEVGRRAGFETRGISFPGHFLVRIDVPGGLALVDPFGGGFVDRAGLKALHARAGGKDADPDAHALEPATKRAILLRMLNNLRSIYAGQR
jgi:regulator of sirC expression with transglutaminase-like and TPR domain